MNEKNWFVYDPDPTDEPGPVLYGPFDTEWEADDYANYSHEDDESGNTVILQARGVE